MASELEGVKAANAVVLLPAGAVIRPRDDTRTPKERYDCVAEYARRYSAGLDLWTGKPLEKRYG
jgi:hypothetical protein